RASEGALVARLEVPDLDNRLAQSRAAVRESEAKLRLLKVGSRPEEVAEQRLRVERAVAWRDLAERGLRRARKALTEELGRLDMQIEQYEAEQSFVRDVLARSRKLMGDRALSPERLREAEMQLKVAGSKKEQAEALKRAQVVAGTREAETELARRKNLLADARATLRLLEAGSRPA